MSTIALLLSPLSLLTSAALPSQEGAALAQAVELPAPPAPAVRITWGDFDGDGRQDALALRPEGGLALLVGTPGGGFEDVTALRGLALQEGVRAASWVDYDGDGTLDLSVVDPSGSWRLLRQEPGGPFVESTRSAGLPQPAGVLAASWIDCDRDGAPDLLLSTWTEVLLYRNAGGGRFAPVELGLALGAPPIGVVPVGPTAPAVASPGSPEAGADTAGVAASRADAGWPPEGSAGRSTGLAPSASATARPGDPQASLTVVCAGGVLDQATGNCLPASSVPALGMLFPNSSQLYLDADSGRVGVGTLAPEALLHVEQGALRVRSELDVTGSVGSGSVQILDADGGAGLHLDADEIQALGADLHINRDNAAGTWINQTLAVTTGGQVGIAALPSPEATLEVGGELRASGAVRGMAFEFPDGTALRSAWPAEPPHPQLAVGTLLVNPPGGCPEAVPIYSLELEVYQEEPAGGGAGTVSTNFTPLRVAKDLDCLSIPLLQSAVSGDHLDTVVVEVEGLQIELTDVLVAEVGARESAAGITREEVAFEFAMIRWTHGGVSNEWDVDQNQGSGGGGPLPSTSRYEYLAAGGSSGACAECEELLRFQSGPWSASAGAGSPCPPQVLDVPIGPNSVLAAFTACLGDPYLELELYFAELGPPYTLEFRHHDVFLQSWALELDTVGVMRERRTFRSTSWEMEYQPDGGPPTLASWDCATSP